MPGLFRNLPNTREGKYPVLLRRDGTVPEWEHFCLGARDPAAPDAIRAYSRECERRNMDPDYVRDLLAMALSWEESSQDEAERRGRWEAARSAGEAAAIEGIFPFPKPADPDGPRHRTDDPDVLAFPNSLAEYRAKVRAEAFEEAAALCDTFNASENATHEGVYAVTEVSKALRVLAAAPYDVRPL